MKSTEVMEQRPWLRELRTLTHESSKLLTAELHQFCEENGLPHWSADDLLQHEKADHDKVYEYLTQFCDAWQGIEEVERFIHMATFDLE